MSMNVDMKQKTDNYFLLDDVIDHEECRYLYHTLQASTSWTLSRVSREEDYLDPFKSFPGFIVVETDGTVKNEHFSGYFRALTFRISKLVRERYGVSLPSKIHRIHLGAKNSHSDTEFHKDCEEEDAWTILGFLNPIWNSQDGGELYIDDAKIDYKPGRFVVFKSNLSHNGGYVTNEKLNYWRITLNIIVRSGDLLEMLRES
jgi:hypothetical protein